MSAALTLLDSRSFRNKLDYFVSVASRKRPKPTDDELADALQPVLDAYTPMPVAPVAAPVPIPAVTLDASDRVAPQVERSIIEKMDDWIVEYAPKVAATASQPDGIRYTSFPFDFPAAEFTGYTNDKTDAPFFVDPSAMTMMDNHKGGWLLPCRMR